MAAVDAGQRALRAVAVRWLVELGKAGPLSRAQVALVAQSLGVSDRTVWRWVAQAVSQVEQVARPQFTLDETQRERLAFWRGNVSALHRELVAAAAAGGSPAPSLRTLHRAVSEGLSPEKRAGLRRCESAAAPAHDVFPQHPATCRNTVWEADCVEASVDAAMDGRLVRPWVTWFIDSATNVVLGAVVTAGPPGRESILSALRTAIMMDEPYGPAGGLPQMVRVNRSKNVLSDAVREALGVFAVAVQDLPGDLPHLTGSVVTLSNALNCVFVAGLAHSDAAAMTFDAFVVALLDWVRWWNNGHRLDALDGRTPLEAWLADTTPLSTVPAEDLRLFTLEDDRRRKITTAGVRWRRRRYVAEWMGGQVGREVRVRWMPHHDHEIGVFDASAGAYLGAASLADQAGGQSVRAMRRVRAVLPDPGQATTLDDLVEQLRLLKVWAGDLSYKTIKDRVNAAWVAAGRPAGELVGKTTVVDLFRFGRRRLNTDLVVAVVQALHPDVGYVAQWSQALQVISAEHAAASQVRVQDGLPQDLAGFTGRAVELDRLRRVLGDGRRDGGAVVISAIEGMAGVGKTRLAVHAGHLLVQEQRFDRVLFVNLRGFHPDPAQPPADPAAVLYGFLRLLGMSGQEIPHELDFRTTAFRGLLAGTRVLVVLDNAADVDQVRPLLPQTPGCPVLVTSRRTLSGLDRATHLAVGVFTAEEARQFLSRAAPGVPVGDDPDAAARIAGRCGHLPLALGLVAGHMRAKPGWTLTDHADWLDERHHDRRLDTGVELALDVSYQHLGADRRRLMRLLALHPGQDLDAYAAAALADTDLDTAQAHLHHLCGDHLLQQGTPGRYAFHDLIRAYAGTRAHDEDRASERRTALTRLFDHYLSTAATAMNTLHPAQSRDRPRIPPARTPTPDLTDLGTAREWLDTERPTLVAVAIHTAAHGWPTHTTRLSRTLFRYLTGGHNTDAMTVHAHAHLAARRSGDPVGQAHALIDLGVANWRLGRYGPAAEHFQHSLSLFRQARDPDGEARTLNNLGLLEGRSARPRVAADHFTQALALHRQTGDRTGQANALTNLGIVEARLGLRQIAADHFAQALTLSRQTGDRDGEAVTLNGLGDVEVRSGRYVPATDHLQQALTLYRELGHHTGEASVLDSLGLLHTRLGQPAQATEFHQKALTIFRETGDRDGEIWALRGLGEAAHTDGRHTDALAHQTAALTIAAELGHREQQAGAHTGLGHAQYALGQSALAREHYRQAMMLYTDLDMPEADDVRARLAIIELPGPDSDS